MIEVKSKIVDLNELIHSIKFDKDLGRSLVHCHGVFDLIHPGHIKHLQTAKKNGDKLLVSITGDKYVNKGPNRPIFNEQLRAENLAALEFVDYVYINYDKDSAELISTIKPDVYVKGIEYKSHDQDITGKISLETQAVEESGGKILYTNDIVFSSSNLLNTYFSNESRDARLFIDKIKAKYDLGQILSAIDKFKDVRVLVIGDLIIDEYIYVDPLGLSGKGLHMVAKKKHCEPALGGSGVISNHLSSFVHSVQLVSLVGSEGKFKNFHTDKFSKNVTPHLCTKRDLETLTKTRYVIKETGSLTKLFETYSYGEPKLNSEESDLVCAQIQKLIKEVDLVIVTDFGNGYLNDQLRQYLCSLDTFISVNAQINSGNRGYNVITRYPRADYISINEPEIRLAMQEQSAPLESLIFSVCKKLNCSNISVTRGSEGVLSHNVQNNSFVKVPALATNIIDKVGAGDSFLALSSLAFYLNFDNDLAAFLGSIAAALNVSSIGNQVPIDKISYIKFLTTLLK